MQYQFLRYVLLLQEYNMRKMLEHSFKAVVQDAKAISGACAAAPAVPALLPPGCLSRPCHPGTAWPATCARCATHSQTAEARLQTVSLCLF
jgi:hypothetical protein